MTTTSEKSWDKISKQLSEVLNKVLTEKTEKSKIESVLKQWANKKEDIIKFVNSSNQKLKKKKDPSAPKKWSTAYLLFCMDNRNKVKESHPSIVATEITKELGKLWKVISPSDKLLYEERSKIEKAKYQQEMESYCPPEDEDQPKKKKKTEGPKRPTSAYMYFCKAARSQTDPLKKTSVTEIGKKWKALKPEERVEFDEQAKVDKERYEKEKEAFPKPEKETKKKVTKAKVSEEEPEKETKKKVAVKVSTPEEPKKKVALKEEPKKKVIVKEEPKPVPKKEVFQETKRKPRKSSSSDEEDEEDLFEDDE